MSLPVVYDCMLFFMRAARPHRVRETFELVDRQVVTYCLSSAVLAEIEDVLTRPRHQRDFPQLTAAYAAVFLDEIARRSRFIATVPDVYHLKRDPKDSKYINLAVAADAQFLVTRDKDMIDLMNQSTPEGAEFHVRFPRLRIIEPGPFVREVISRMTP